MVFIQLLQLTVPTVVRLIVSQGGRALHLVNDNQFLDSPEWFGVSTDEYFQVTVTALETSTILMWHRLVIFNSVVFIIHPSNITEIE